MSLASYRAALSRDTLAEKKGFEPLRRFRPSGFQDRSLQPDLGISPYNLQTNKLYHNFKIKVNIKIKLHYIIKIKLHYIIFKSMCNMFQENK